MRATSRNRQPPGSSAGGQFVSTPSPDIKQQDAPLQLSSYDMGVDGVDTYSINPCTAKYSIGHRNEELTVRARVREHRVSFKLDPEGWWSATTEGGMMLYRFRSMPRDYWKTFRENKNDVIIWGSAIVCDLLNKGEVSPAAVGSLEGVQAALTATFTTKKRNTARHMLSSCMARIRAAQMLTQEDLKSRERLGGAILTETGKEQCARTLDILKAAFKDFPITGPKFDGDNTDVYGVYFGEDRKLISKLLKEPIRDYSALDLAIEATVNPKEKDPVTCLNLCIYGILQDDDIATKMSTLGMKANEDTVASQLDEQKTKEALDQFLSSLQDHVLDTRLPFAVREQLACVALQTIVNTIRPFQINTQKLASWQRTVKETDMRHLPLCKDLDKIVSKLLR